VCSAGKHPSGRFPAVVLPRTLGSLLTWFLCFLFCMAWRPAEKCSFYAVELAMAIPLLVHDLAAAPPCPATLLSLFFLLTHASVSYERIVSCSPPRPPATRSVFPSTVQVQIRFFLLSDAVRNPRASNQASFRGPWPCFLLLLFPGVNGLIFCRGLSGVLPSPVDFFTPPPCFPGGIRASSRDRNLPPAKSLVRTGRPGPFFFQVRGFF